MAALDVLFQLLGQGPTIAQVLSPASELQRGIAALERLIAQQEAGVPAAPAEPETPEDRLRVALQEGREVAVGYTRALDGASGMYTLRPYEVGYHPTSGRPVLWAQVVEGTGASPLHASNPATGGAHTGEIHALLWDRLDLEGLRLTAREFSPAWPLRPESVP